MIAPACWQRKFSVSGQHQKGGIVLLLLSLAVA